jgi:pyruvate dehydrogenase E2 component (dihydrolipoamide acetyltransferase)
MAEQLHVDLAQVKGTGANGQIMREDVEAFAAQTSAATPAPPAATPAPEATQAPVVTPPSSGRIIVTPAARKLAEEQQVDLRQVRGSGPEGRIVLADVQNYAGAPKQAAPIPAPQPAVQPQPIPQPQAVPAGGRRPLTRIRHTIAQRMTQSKTTVPHFYITVAVEMDAALKLREQINEALKPENIKVTVNDLVIRATALALKRFPNLNASFAGDAVELHEQVHIGVAVALPSGLVTVTVRDADTKTLRQIAVEMVALTTRAREGKAQAGDMGGQTFTISNLGMYGVESFIAIINPPDAGILAIGAATPTPVVQDGQVVVRSIMHVTISGDHRVTDGAEAAQFVNEVKRILENPWGLVL